MHTFFQLFWRIAVGINSIYNSENFRCTLPPTVYKSALKENEEVHNSYFLLLTLVIHLLEHLAVLRTCTFIIISPGTTLNQDSGIENQILTQKITCKNAPRNKIIDLRQK